MAKEETRAEGKAASKSPDGEKLLAAGYETYPAKFASKFFSAGTVAKSVKNIKAAGFTRDILKWGYYQKYAPADPRDKSKWGSDPKLYENWEASVDEAREALRKQPVDPGRAGPDPDHPTVLADNLLEHLDTAVKIALFDKYLHASSNDSGVEIDVVVQTQPIASRRHAILTSWHNTAGNPTDPKYKHDRLTIVMTCPLGGWIGTAIWKYNGPSRFTRFTATYTVPAVPSHDSGQIIFIFNGLESMPDPARSHPPAILQPVLQWTPGGDNWAIRSWYVPSSYTPSIDQMPGLTDELNFTIPENAAWTKATQVQPGEVLTGVIEWTGFEYQASFERNGNTVAKLGAPGILPLTYPVCVIEAYNYDTSSSKRDLVDVRMDNIALYRADMGSTPVEPSWEVGTDTDSADGIHHGNGKLQRYRVIPSNNNATLTFTKK